MFNPTFKQDDAIRNMEKFCGINSHRDNFSDKDEFDTYFKRLQGKGSKKAKTLDMIKNDKEGYKKLQEKKRNRITIYYSNYDSLRKYAVTYINRYFPTLGQCELKLLEKNSNYETVSKVMSSIGCLINEDTMIQSFVRQLRSRGKNIGFITTKLYQKRYDSELIKKTIGKLREHGTLLTQYTLEERINYFKRQGKSRMEVYRKYVERNEDKEIVSEILDKVYGINGDEDILVGLIQKYKDQNVTGKRIISRLLTRGFKYKDITNILNKKVE